MSDNPYKPPAPLVLAKACARSAWRDDIPDSTRMLLEWAADTIRELADKNLFLSHGAEQLEGEVDLLCDLCEGKHEEEEGL